MSSIVLRKWISPWSAWSRRWHDARMAPVKAPWWLADMGRLGVLVGPFVCEQFRIRDEVILYPSLEAAERELYLRSTDFQPAVAWAKASLHPFGREKHAAFIAKIESALRCLRLHDRDGYKREIIQTTKEFLEAFGHLRGGAPLTYSAEFQSRLDARDKEVDESAREVFGKLKKPEGESS